jgi:hypothetical protein
VEHGRIDSGGHDQAHLQRKHRVRDQVARMRDEHRQPARQDQ